MAQAQTADSALTVTDTSVSTNNNVVVTDSAGSTTLFAGGQQSGFSGKVGVGTSAPAYKLTVYDDAQANFRLSQKFKPDTTHSSNFRAAKGSNFRSNNILGNNGAPIENFDINFIDATEDGIFRDGTALISTSSSNSPAGGSSFSSSNSMSSVITQAPHIDWGCVQSAENPALTFATTNYGWYVPHCVNNSYTGNTLAMYLDADLFALDVNTQLNKNLKVADDFLVNTADHITYAREIKVTAQPFPSDFVFDKDYKMMPLHELENYVNANHHLPQLPSAAEQTEKGVDLGEMQNKLLQKIEELTLIVIEQNKRIDELEKESKH